MNKKKLKIRVAQAEKVTDDMATILVVNGFGVVQKNFDVNVYADEGGIRVEVNNENGDVVTDSEWSWEELAEG